MIQPGGVVAIVYRVRSRIFTSADLLVRRRCGGPRCRLQSWRRQSANVRANLVNGSLVLYTTDFPQITRVPEARTWAMLLLGFAGMGFARALAARKRRRAMAFEGN